MPTYPILIHPDKRLRLVATPVTHFDEALEETVANMFETMYAKQGIGLAATQVDIQERIIVMDVPREESEDDANFITDKLTLINAKVVSASEETKEHEEGCLSIPGQYAEVTRPANIHFRYQDTSGTVHEADADGLLAVCIQHEIDHLNGVLFIDHISRLKRERIEKKLAKSLRQK